MSDIAIIVLVSWLAGAAAFFGGLFARFEGSPETIGKREFTHGVVGFGGGVLVAAIALALVPEGVSTLSPPVLAMVFCLGGVVFCFVDARLSMQGGSKAQFMAMLLDFVPEAIAMGAVFVHNRRLGIVLALFIGVQNLPEGFNAFREIVASRARPRDALTVLFSISFLGPVAASAGYLLLHGRESLTAGIMSFAAGGILYLIFQDIAPQAKMRRHWIPPLGAVLGFTVGMIGTQVLG